MQVIYQDGEENGHFLPRGLASERIAGDRSRPVAHLLRSPGALAVNLRLEEHGNDADALPAGDVNKNVAHQAPGPLDILRVQPSIDWSRLTLFVETQRPRRI